VFLKTKFL